MKLTTIYLTVALAVAGCASKETAKTDAEKAVEKAATEQKTKVTQKIESKKEKAQKPVVEAQEGVESAATAEAFGSVTCKSGGDERTVATHKTETGGCEVKYTKNGETNSVANAVSDETYCNGVVGKIKGNLEAAGFTCSGS